MELRKFIATTIREYLNENYLENNFNDIIYGDNFNLFKNKIKSYHGRIKDGLIVRFYLNEFLKYYDVNKLNNITSWSSFVDSIHNLWDRKKTSKQQEIVFRSGGISDEMFFSNNIYVASVYGGNLNAYILNFKNPYKLDCMDSDWMNIVEPDIMRGESYDGNVSTDNIVEFIKSKKKEYDGIIFYNLYEGSGADSFGSSTIYVALDKNNVVNITNN